MGPVMSVEARVFAVMFVASVRVFAVPLLVFSIATPWFEEPKATGNNGISRYISVRGAVASFERSTAAVALTLALVTAPSASFAVVMDRSAIVAVCANAPLKVANYLNLFPLR